MAKKKKITTSKKKTPVKKRSIFLRLFRWGIALAIWGGLILVGIIAWHAKDLPDITQRATFERRSSIIVKAADGTVLERYGESKGKNLQVSELPPHLIHAVLATEDRRFYNHYGIDPWGIARAMVTNVIKGRFAQGGSTITQQLAKNLFLTHQRKLKRKIQEAILAVWLERELSKDEILSAYMNRVYLGSGTYGFEAAAQLYFDKPASDVNLREAAVLAGLLKAPSKYSPHNNLDLAKQRSDVVLKAMVDAGFIKKADMSKQKLAISLPNKKGKQGSNTRYFTDWVIEGLDDLVGTPGIDMIVETTLDASLQNTAQTRLVNAIDRADEMSFISEGAILSMKPDGAILAMIGGYNYGKSQFNRSTQAMRSPGSAFKPIVFLAALQKGWKPSDKIMDSPITSGKYRPKNFANQYLGTVDLETALSKSLNTATVRLTKEIGISSVLKTAKQVGIIAPLERDLSLALGSSGISMLEMGTAYATISNGGHRVFPYAISRITDNQGRVLYQRKTPKAYQQVLATDDVRQLSHMMRSVINYGTGRGAKLPFPAQGKTGTSQGNRDAWFVGYTDNVVSIVWLGNDDNSPMRKVTGGGLPARIWRDVMTFAHPRHTTTTFQSIAPYKENGTTQKKNKKDGGFSNMLDRLFSGEGKLKPKPRPKGDYSNLNQ